MILSENVKTLKGQIKQIQNLKYKPKYEIMNPEFIKTTLASIEQLTSNLGAEQTKSKNLEQQVEFYRQDSKDNKSYFTGHEAAIRSVLGIIQENNNQISKLLYRLQQGMINNDTGNQYRIVNEFIKDMNLRMNKLEKSVQSMIFNKL